MTTRIGFAEFTLEPLEGVFTGVDERLEVSLDCSACRRRKRTVEFPSVGNAGRCMPSGHEFRGSLVRVIPLPFGGRYEFRYVYQPFVDAKYPDEARYLGLERGAPTWVRVRFHVRCSRCARDLERSTQSNLGRPGRSLCACGASLFTDAEAPRMWWVEAATEVS